MTSLPIWIFEPTSFLQRMAEPFLYANFLQKAAEAEEPIHRLAWLAAFNVAILSNTERSGKPFNPILGETFEFVAPSGFKFLAEQVSHHPPIGAAITASPLWTCKQEAHVKTKFHGNSIEIFAVGNTHIIMNKTGEHFVWKQPNSCAHNIFVGGMWIDHWGEIEIKSNMSKGERCLLKFHKTGWFGDNRRSVSGSIFDSRGNLRIMLVGKWNSYLCAKNIDDKGKKSEEEYFLWQKVPEECDNKFKLPPFTRNELCKLDKKYERILPPTDSRLRSDRRALEEGDLTLAGAEKYKIEERQRAEASARKKNWKRIFS
jgi:hypothetical protein